MRGAATWAAAALVLIGCKANRVGTSGVSEKAQPSLYPQTCEEARRDAWKLTYDDVRFVECGRGPDGKGEAFSLGEPVDRPPHGGTALDARFYSPGHCQHGGGALTELNIFYANEHLAAAIECSRLRCEARDPLGCRDLGALHSDDPRLPGSTRNEKVALPAFQSGCDLGDGESCLELGGILDGHGENDRAMAAYLAGCRATPPEIAACRKAADGLIEQGRESEAKPLLLRACRGVRSADAPSMPLREGCGILARMAARGGDVPSQREYWRLACAYGGGEDFTCARLGLALAEDGDASRAVPYLRKACGILPGATGLTAKACEALKNLAGRGPK
jgi:TPR repeat protein